MSYAISRRSFLKSAAVLTAAVAAAGVLAGCGSTGKPVNVKFVFDGKILHAEMVTVAEKETSIQLTAIGKYLPEGYALADKYKDVATIDIKNNEVEVELKFSDEFQFVTVSFRKQVGNLWVEMTETDKILVKKDVTSIDPKKVTLPEGFKLAESQDYTIRNLHVQLDLVAIA